MTLDVRAFNWSCKMRLDIANMPLCLLPSSGLCRMAITPFRAAIDWNFIDWNFLFASWRHPDVTVPSMKSQQCSKGEPLSLIAAAYHSSCCGDNQVWLKSCNKCLWALYIKPSMWLLISDSSGTDLPNTGIISAFRKDNQNAWEGSKILPIYWKLSH